MLAREVQELPPQGRATARQVPTSRNLGNIDSQLQRIPLIKSWFGGKMRVSFASSAAHKLIVQVLTYSENGMWRQCSHCAA